MHRKYGAPGCRVSRKAVYIAEYTHGAKIIPTALQLACAAAISPSFSPRSRASLTICASTTADLCNDQDKHVKQDKHVSHSKARE